MIWHILIIISLIVNIWTIYKIWDLYKAMDIVLDMFDTTKDALEMVKNRLTKTGRHFPEIEQVLEAMKE